MISRERMAELRGQGLGGCAGLIVVGMLYGFVFGAIVAVVVLL